MTALLDVRLSTRPVVFAGGPGVPSDAGAECVFVGRTRGEHHPVHGPLVRLDYSAYEPMALRVLGDLAAEVAADFGCRVVRVHHATGPVAVGEASVLVYVAGGHRDQAFAACRMLIDRLKAEAPIWKREVWADGATWSPGAPVAASRTERDAAPPGRAEGIPDARPAPGSAAP